MVDQLMTLPVPGTLGNDTGGGADGVQSGLLAPTALSKYLTSQHGLPCLLVTEDGGAYVDDTTDANDAGADDVQPLPNPPAVGDSTLVGHATQQFKQIDVNIGTQGVGTWTVTVKFWNGTAYTAVTTLVDGTTAWTATTGIKSITFDAPVGWVKNTINGVLAYWIQIEVATYSAITTACLVTQVWVVTDDTNQLWVDDTTDANDAGATDFNLAAAYPVLNDCTYFGLGEKFPMVRVDVGTQGVATWTYLAEYWKSDLTWATVPAPITGGAGLPTAAAGNQQVQFEPPSDWIANTAANGPNGQAGWFIRLRLTAFTSITTQPVGDQAWIYPLVTGAAGTPAPLTGTITKVDYTARTRSGAAGSSRFLLINATTGIFDEFVWNAILGAASIVISLAVAFGDQIVLLQIQEEGTTEFANASFHFTIIGSA